MSDPWAGVAPAAVTSVVTTLVTLGITAGVSKIRSASSSQEYPLLIRRTTGSNWVVRNESKRSLVRFNYNLYDAESNQLQLEHWYGAQVSVIAPDEEVSIGKVEAGYSLTFYWWTLKRNKPNEPKSTSVIIRGDSDEYRPKAERGDRYGK